MTTKTTHYDCCSMPTTELCPLHAAAPEMLALLRDITGPDEIESNVTHWQRARALLARIEGA